MRHAFIGVLVSLISSFPLDRRLASLAQLRSEDLDLDFFLNLTHIQVHRRQRGMRRLADALDTQVRDRIPLPIAILPFRR